MVRAKAARSPDIGSIRSATGARASNTARSIPLAAASSERKADSADGSGRAPSIRSRAAASKLWVLAISTASWLR